MLKIIFELILSAKCLHKISNFEYFCVCYCERYLFHTHPGSTITFSFLIMMMTTMMLAWRLVEEIELMFLPWWWKRIKIWPPRDDKKQSRSFLVIGHRKSNSKNICFISPWIKCNNLKQIWNSTISSTN